MGALKEREDLREMAEEQDYMSQTYMDGYCRIFEPIQIREDVWLSIQASYGHYCKPRKTLKDLYDYSHWEFALFNKENFIRVSDIIPELKSIGEIETYFDSSVYPYVPTDLVEEVYLAFK